VQPGGACHCAVADKPQCVTAASYECSNFQSAVQVLGSASELLLPVTESATSKRATVFFLLNHTQSAYDSYNNDVKCMRLNKTSTRLPGNAAENAADDGMVMTKASRQETCSEQTFWANVSVQLLG
jgi:hypothetical protein